MVSALGALLLAGGMIGGGYMIYLAAKAFKPVPLTGQSQGIVGCPSCTTKMGQQVAPAYYGRLPGQSRNY